MCLFSGQIQSVSKTKILVARVHPCKLEKKRDRYGIIKTYKVPYGVPMQFTVYSNTVKHTPSESGPSAMVLPVPLIRGSNRIKFIDMSGYADIFEDLDMMFPTMLSRSASMSTDSAVSQTLPVMQVGSYKASLVPNIKTFDNLSDGFALNPGTAEVLQKYYGSGYAFVVCRLDEGTTEHTYHPFAYTHEIRTDGQLFIPTRHYHDLAPNNPYTTYHTSYSQDADQDLSDYYANTMGLEDKWMDHTIKRRNIQTHTSKPKDADWDHEIYVINAATKNNKLLGKSNTPVASAKRECMRDPYMYLNAGKLPRHIALGKIHTCEKIKIEPDFPYNCDLFI
jgi:hypothetical protein